MRLYFSGVSGAQEFAMLKSADVTNLLVDQFDLDNIDGWAGNKALDCGAYRAFKKGQRIDLDEYMFIAEDPLRDFTFRTAVDVIGDPGQTFANWNFIFKRRPLAYAPVWQWNADRKYLKKYLDDAEVVGIGGLVSLMRAKGKTAIETEELKRQRDFMLADLMTLCRQHPRRFHIFGVNWLRAIEALRENALSIDTSKFLDAARYGHVIFVNTNTDRLSQAPAKALAESPQFTGIDLTDRVARCVYSARSMESFCAVYKAREVSNA